MQIVKWQIFENCPMLIFLDVKGKNVNPVFFNFGFI